ncbi:MAG: biotin carboxylase N-terminal domain-containing protein [Vicinamibacterales bacterium]
MRKILIANRGEIAVRVIRACRDLGLGSVAVYSDVDRASLHVRMADEAYHIGPGPAVDSYLKIGAVIDAARRSGADAVHPGYGFLAESAGFASACRDAGLVFIGPTPEAIAGLGNKTAARGYARQAGVPVVEGTDEPLGPDVSDDVIGRAAARIGYPVMVKAVAGGGGKGMRVAREPSELPAALRLARSEAQASFGDPRIYLEKRIEHPRHVEVQVLADAHGTVVPFVERECSIQRRHQKVIEESPSTVVSPALRCSLQQAAAAVAVAAGYTSAGTVEFLLDADGRFAFLEMNTRLQVEHPVTEMVTGVDLVTWQIRIARGEPLTLDPAMVATPRGHAIECRVYAEDADAGFVPSPGQLTTLRTPDGPWVRHDGGMDEGARVSVFYDAMIAKLIVWGATRAEAVARLRRALLEYRVGGVRTSVPFLLWLIDQKEFRSAAFHTAYLDELLHQRAGRPFSEPDVSREEVAMIAAALYHSSQRVPPVVEAGAWKARARMEGLRS